MKQFTLRPITLDDAELIFVARNSDAVRPFMLTQDLIAPEVHAKWMQTRMERMEVAPYFLFLEGDMPLGVVGMSFYDAHAKSGEWGAYIFEAKAPRGAGTLMQAAFMERVFGMGVNKMTALVLADNIKSLRALEKLGFAQKGLLVGCGPKGEDMVSFALQAHEWPDARRPFAQALETVDIL